MEYTMGCYGPEPHRLCDGYFGGTGSPCACDCHEREYKALASCGVCDHEHPARWRDKGWGDGSAMLVDVGGCKACACTPHQWEAP